MKAGGEILQRTAAQHDLFGPELDLRRKRRLRKVGRHRAQRRQPACRLDALVAVFIAVLLAILFVILGVLAVFFPAAEAVDIELPRDRTLAIRETEPFTRIAASMRGLLGGGS